MSLMRRFPGSSAHRPYRRKGHDDNPTAPSGAVPTEGVSPIQFFLADLYAERLAGTADSPELEAPAAGSEQAVPSRDGRDDAILVPAAAR